MEEDFDPVMQAKFNEKLSDFVAKKRFICLPNEATYDSILAALIKSKNGSKLERHEWNYVQRHLVFYTDFMIREEDQLNRLHFLREQEREGARKQQKRQAEQMLQESAKRNAPISVGQTVRIPIPSVDRAKTDPRNLLGVVMEEEDGFYRIGTDHGILSQQYSRNQIEPSSSQFVSKENVPDKEISLRTAVGADLLSGGQGHKHCNCLQGCKTGKCNCRSLGRLCNSRCHNSTSCKNK
ncbi:putative SCAN domain-containing protein 3-like [Ditylenchus destructor]|uniref:SCAN domain-containing protein 3-like n=1 Tax=Ditylenchus destructor TaxID=166010 RepID=A0AAD4QU15_9BILA|nr:putative SCAN domain-containing protein 3-like [Ditylenchus destructor]